MDRSKFLEDLQKRVEAMVGASPAADLKKNFKALIDQQFAKVNLVSRQELETQKRVLAKSRERLDALERQLAELKAKQEQVADK